MLIKDGFRDAIASKKKEERGEYNFSLDPNVFSPLARR